MKAVLAVPLLCWALGAGAECPVGHPREMPAIPDGTTTTPAEMRRAELVAEKYLWQARTYLDCGEMSRLQYNQLLTQVEIFNDAYNEEMIKFRSRTIMNYNVVAEQ